MDSKLLRKVMRDKGITVKCMCEFLQMSRKAFWAKCTGRSEFKLSEMQKILELIGTEHAVKIFYPESVQ